MSYDTTQDDRLFALLGYLLAIPTWVLAPAVIYLVKKDQSPFVAFHSLQSLFLLAAEAVICIACGVLSTIFMMMGPLGILSLPLGFLAGVTVLARIVFTLVAAIKAYGGEWYKVPILGDLVPVKETV